jgi:hypothetical protein
MRLSALPALWPVTRALVPPAFVPASLGACLLLMTGCSGSGFWRYEADTLTIPGANPNMPVGGSENFQRTRHGVLTEPAPLLTEAGDIWPGPTQPVPTLKDLQKQQTAEVNGGGASSTLAPLPPLPSLPGYEISEQDPGRAAPPQAFPGNTVPIRNGHVPIRGDQGYAAPAGAAAGNIIVPNGNGTSTVISPTGQVTTIPTPK